MSNTVRISHTSETSGDAMLLAAGIGRTAGGEGLPRHPWNNIHFVLKNHSALD